MKTELKAKFLQHLAQKHKDSGFTLIELLVVIVIIGILAAIALPSFLNQANKARQSEAKTYAGSINRAQQAYFVEYGEFGIATELEGGVPNATQNYTYVVVDGSTNTPPTALIKASANKQNLKSYAGLVAADKNQTPAIVCETKATSQTPPAPTYTAATQTMACDGTSAPVGQ